MSRHSSFYGFLYGFYESLISLKKFIWREALASEKWIVYNNINRKWSWLMQNEVTQTTPKAETHPKNIMLTVWYNYKGVLHFEILPKNQMINSKVFNNSQVQQKNKKSGHNWQIVRELFSSIIQSTQTNILNCPFYLKSRITYLSPQYEYLANGERKHPFINGKMISLED